MKFLFV